MGPKRKLLASPIKFTLLPALTLAFAGVWGAQASGALDPSIGWFVGINVGTYLTWWLDKRQAQGKLRVGKKELAGGFRVPEWTLHLLSALGGGPAAVLAMGRLRHKTRKRIFKLLHPLLAALGVAALGWYLMGR